MTEVLPAGRSKPTDGPFATLERARDAVRQLQRSAPAKDVVVLIRGGVYRLSETVVFGLEDSGIGERTITYAAYPNEKPIFSSATHIEGWKKLDSAPAAIPESARAYTWVADVPQCRGESIKVDNLAESCWVENVLEGLDEPGEWVLDSRAGKLYLWPRSPLSERNIMAPQLILLCDYGPGIKDVNKGNEILNNYVHHCGEIYWHSPGIFVWQSGENRVANNLIHDLPYTGIIVSGGGKLRFFETSDQREISRTIRWHEVGEPGPRTYEQIKPFVHTRRNVVELNEIHHVMQKMGDGNGIYIRMSGEGNIIRRNYIHHLIGPTRMQWAIRTDGGQRDTLITENVIYKCVVGGITLKLNNHAENNIIADILEANDPENVHGVRPVAYFKLREGPMTGAAIQRNIIYHPGQKAKFYDEGKSKTSPVLAQAKDANTDYNLYYCAGNSELSQSLLKKMRQDGVDAHSLVANPLFVDPANGDFRLKPDSPALSLGIQPIDISSIGLKGDASHWLSSSAKGKTLSGKNRSQ